MLQIPARGRLRYRNLHGMVQTIHVDGAVRTASDPRQSGIQRCVRVLRTPSKV
jgi:hypothetical protein